MRRARRDTDDRQLRRFAEQLRDQPGDEVRDLAPDSFPSWEAALRFVVQLAESRPLLLVVDEAPRLTRSGSDFADTVSAVWENAVRAHPLMVALSGSTVTVMERMLGPQGGLHRGATVERRMDPFSLAERCRTTLASWSRGQAGDLADHPDVRVFTPDDLLAGQVPRAGEVTPPLASAPARPRRRSRRAS